MPVTIGNSGQVTPESLIKAIEDLNVILGEMAKMREVYFGENPPNGTPEEGDMWYNPVEDRFRIYVVS